MALPYLPCQEIDKKSWLLPLVWIYHTEGMVLLLEEAHRLVMDLNALGQLVRSARVSMRMSRKEVAQGAGIVESYVGHIERGIRRPEIDVLSGLATTLRLDFDTLSELAGYSRRRIGRVERRRRLDGIRKLLQELQEQVDQAGYDLFTEEAQDEPRDSSAEDAGPDEPDAPAAGC